MRKEIDEKMIALIQDRITEILKDLYIRKEMIKWKRDGFSDEDIRKKITFIAIATLYGV